MANNRIQHKRSTVSGVVPTTSDVSAGELGINLADRKLFTSNGSAVFELGSNLSNLAVSANLTVGASGTIVLTPGAGVYANNTLGTAGQVLTSNSTSVYWSTVTVSPVGSNTQVQFNDSGSFGASAGFTFNKTSNTLAISNTISTNNAVVSGGISVNGSFGSVGDVLTSNGTVAYWAAPGGSKPLAMTLIFGR
jgi:hypothetical protein